MKLKVARKQDITAEMILDVLSHRRETGEFFWRLRGRGRRVGTKAGRTMDGYGVIRLYGLQVKTHHIVWFLETGEWPEMLDHINRIRDDNRIENLRVATKLQNIVNRVLPTLPRSGLRGVSRHKTGLWRARVSGDTWYFKTPEEAHRKYRDVLKERFGDFVPAEVLAGVA